MGPAMLAATWVMRFGRTWTIGSEGPHTVGELGVVLEMEQSAVSHQLRLLRHLGLVVGRRRGRNVVYALHDRHIATLLDEAIGHTEHVTLGIADPPTEALHPR